MAVTSNVTFRKMRPIAGLEVDIHERAEKLRRYAPSMQGADVLVEPTDRRHRSGRRYRVRIAITLPGDTIVVAHVPPGRTLLDRADAVRKRNEVDPEHRDASRAVRDAFAAARRKLQDHLRRQRGAVKAHSRRTRATAGRAAAQPRP